MTLNPASSQNKKIESIRVQLENIRLDVKPFLKHIDEIEILFREREPQIESFLPETGRFARLREDLVQVQKEFPRIEDRPPLYGLVIGVKDIFHIDDFPTHAGSRLPANELKGPEAVIVTRLKKKGAVVFGKTVTTEFAYFAPGPTRNPHRPYHTPGGSSSGSAAAVSAGMIPFALGSQTIGSVIRPASYCGVFGFKPTYGRIPTTGVIPVAPSVDTVGFFTKNANNAEYLCKFIFDNWDAGRYIFRKPILGIPISPYMSHADQEMKLFFKEICGILKSSGYSIQEVPIIENFDLIYKHHNNLVAYEAARSHKIWISKYRHLYHPKTLELIDRGLTIDEEKYKEALTSCIVLRDEIMSLQTRVGVDLWVSPPAQGAAPAGLTSTGNPVMNLPWSHCGFPSVNLPVGYNSDGLPLGFQVSSGFNLDEELIHWARKISEDLQEPIRLGPEHKLGNYSHPDLQ